MDELSAMADIMSISVSYTGRYRPTPQPSASSRRRDLHRAARHQGFCHLFGDAAVTVKPTCSASACCVRSLGRAPTSVPSLSRWPVSSEIRGHERRHAPPGLCAAGRSQSRRRAPAIGLRRTPQAGHRQNGQRSPRADSPTHRAVPRGLDKALRPRAASLCWPRPFLRRRDGSHATHPHRPHPTPLVAPGASFRV
jgi:hypothetical protein